MLKSQYIVVLAKLLVCQDKNWSQNGIASELCLSPSQVNSALKRLVTAGLITPSKSFDGFQYSLFAIREQKNS